MDNIVTEVKIVQGAIGTTVQIFDESRLVAAYVILGRIGTPPPTRTIPTVPPAPAPEKKYYLRLVRKGQKDGQGNELLGLSVCPVGTSDPISTVHAISGQPSRQNFRLGGTGEKPGTMEPLPQGAYTLGIVEFKSANDYSVAWGKGLGPVWIALTPKFNTERGGFGIHQDTGAYGTAGCVGLVDLPTLMKVVGWFKEYDLAGQELIVDWQVAAAPEKFPKPAVNAALVSPNQSNRSAAIDTLVLHNTDCDYAAAISTLMNPAEQVSAHLVIDRDGSTAQLVPFNKKAWHAVQANSRSIGIEIVAWKDAKGMTPAQEKTLIAWIRWIQQEYGIKTENIIPHRKVVATDCPGWIWESDEKLETWKKEKLS